MTLVVTHNAVTGAVADPTALIDGPAWDANHTLSGVASPVQGGTGVANDAASTITISGAYAITATLTATTGVTFPTAGTLATLAGTETLTNKTLTSPAINGATILTSTYNKVTITAPATSATLTIPDGVTLTGPAASGTAMTLGNAETVTGAKTFGSAGAVGKLKIAGTTSGSTILDATAVASGTLTLPAATDTLVGLATADTLTNKTLTSPNLTTPVGGTAAGSTLTINGTSNGSPSSAFLKLQTNGQFTGLGGQSTPLSLLHIGAGSDAPSLTGSALYLSNNGNTSFEVRDSTNDIAFGMFTNHTPDVVAMGSRTSHPVWIQTNGGNNFAFHVSGGFSVGSTTDPGTNCLSVAGSLFCSGTTTHTFGGSVSATFNQNAATRISVSNNNATGSGNAQATFQASNGTASFEFGMRGTAEVAYGALTAGRAFMYGAADFVIMADGSFPIIFAPGGNAELARFSASGGLSIGTTTDAGVGALLANTSIKSKGATSGIGYATGAGGTVTQITNRSTGVTLNTVSGAITLISQVNAAVSPATQSTVVVTNSAVAATDTVIMNQKSGTDKYLIYVVAVGAGSFTFSYYSPPGGTTNEAPVFNFNVIKGVTS